MLSLEIACDAGVTAARARRQRPDAMRTGGHGPARAGLFHDGQLGHRQHQPLGAGFGKLDLYAGVTAAAFGGDDLPKPATVVMAYTGHSDVSRHEPPTYVVVGENDGIAPPAVMERRVEALRSRGTTVEYCKYKNLGHGFGVGTGTSAEGWIADAIRFWRRCAR